MRLHWFCCFTVALITPNLRGGELPVDFDRGVNHAHVHRGDRGYGSPVSQAELATLKSIGVNAVALTPFGYQRSFDDDTVRFGGDRSMTDDHLRAEVANARALGIRVALKPHIWSRDFWEGDQWHGTVSQKNAESHARWWSAYRDMTLHYLHFAQETGIETYCLGTELVKMTRRYPDEWIGLIREARRIYKGRLAYVAHWDREPEGVTFWDHLDVIGISAYFPLDAPEGATVDQLSRAWRPHARRLEKLHRKYSRPIIFFEAGYRPVDNCHQKPWLYSGGEPDTEAQVRAYQAMFSALSEKSWWRGSYLWKTFTDPRAGQRRGRQGFIFRNLPAEKVVRNWYLNPAADR